jgi:citrate lyase subunit beta/citryl-CoA lyase
MYSLHEDIHGFMPTKIRTYHDLLYYDKLLTQLEIENNFPIGKFKLVPLIENTTAVMDAYNIAKASSRTIALCFGGEDLLDDLSGLHGTPPRAFDYPRAVISHAARACGILPIDTPYLELNDFEGFKIEETVSFEQGFAGCLLIHPRQIPVANQCFTPSEAEIHRSNKIIEAIEEAKKRGSGVAMLDGKMIGPPMRKRAEKVIRLMNQINKNGLVNAS